MGETGDIVPRPAVRALLLTPERRLFLLQVRLPDTRFWLTPGGGLNASETDEQALRRELREETGREGFEIGPAAWRRSHVFEWKGRRFRQSETYYVIETKAFEPARDQLEDEEREVIAAHGWWSVEEIERSVELFVPRRLGRFLRLLLEEGPPEEPIDVGT